MKYALLFPLLCQVANALKCNYAFLSSTESTGDLGGYRNAHRTCQQLASESTNPEIVEDAANFVAWLSYSPSFGIPVIYESASDFIQGGFSCLQDYNKNLVANNKTELLSGKLLRKIDVTEKGLKILGPSGFEPSTPADLCVWTSTLASGVSIASAGAADIDTLLQDCNDWTTDVFEQEGLVGRSSSSNNVSVNSTFSPITYIMGLWLLKPKINQVWTEDSLLPCSESCRLYCMSFSPPIEPTPLPPPPTPSPVDDVNPLACSRFVSEQDCNSCGCYHAPYSGGAQVCFNYTECSLLNPTAPKECENVRTQCTITSSSTTTVVTSTQKATSSVAGDENVNAVNNEKSEWWSSLPIWLWATIVGGVVIVVSIVIVFICFKRRHRRRHKLASESANTPNQSSPLPATLHSTRQSSRRHYSNRGGLRSMRSTSSRSRRVPGAY